MHVVGHPDQFTNPIPESSSPEFKEKFTFPMITNDQHVCMYVCMCGVCIFLYRQMIAVCKYVQYLWKCKCLIYLHISIIYVCAALYAYVCMYVCVLRVASVDSALQNARFGDRSQGGRTESGQRGGNSSMYACYVCMYVVLTVHVCMYVCVEVGSHRRSGDSFGRFGRKGHFIGQLFDNGHLRC
jgi:hypothetical protein